MKLVFAVTVALAAVLVYSERCVDVKDCQLVACRNGSNVICERAECTCSPIPKQCLGLRDCNTAVRCPNRQTSWHCVDGTCQCIAL